MKKVTFPTTLLLALVSLHGAAQTDQQGNKPVKTGNEWQMPKDVLLRSKTFSENMQKTCGLDDATTKKVFNAFLGNTKSVDEIRIGAGSEKEKKDALAANQQQFDQTIRGILTPAQFDIYLKNKPKS